MKHSVSTWMTLRQAFITLIRLAKLECEHRVDIKDTN